MNFNNYTPDNKLTFKTIDDFKVIQVYSTYLKKYTNENLYNFNFKVRDLNKLIEHPNNIIRLKFNTGFPDYDFKSLNNSVCIKLKSSIQDIINKNQITQGYFDIHDVRLTTDDINIVLIIK
jgi:hypothetical protein